MGERDRYHRRIMTPYEPRRTSRSDYLDLRGIRCHCRVWPGKPEAPWIFMLHGWMDVSASFQFLIDVLDPDWTIIAPDWRGYGESSWSGERTYWFPDYLADLEAVLDHYQPGTAVNLLGHSMGGNVANLYAGIRPGRIRRLISVEGFGMSGAAPEQAPSRYAKWLDQLASPAGFRPYASREELARRLMEGNPRLPADKAAFLANHWGREMKDGSTVLRSDPAHKHVNPVLYRLEEGEACWRAVTAPVLWVVGSETRTLAQIKLTEAEHKRRQALFRDLQPILIPGAGHMVHHDQPELLAREVGRFVQ